MTVIEIGVLAFLLIALAVTIIFGVAGLRDARETTRLLKETEEILRREAGRDQ